MTLSIVVAFSVLEGAFRLLLRFIQSLVNLSFLNKALLSLLWLLIHSWSLCPVLFISAWLFLWTILFLTVPSCSVSCTTIKSLHISFPHRQPSPIFTLRTVIFLFSHLLFSPKPANSYLSGATAVSLLLTTLNVCRQHSDWSLHTLHIAVLLQFMPNFLLGKGFTSFLWGNPVFLEARLVFDRGPQESWAPGRQANK